MPDTSPPIAPTGTDGLLGTPGVSFTLRSVTANQLLVAMNGGASNAPVQLYGDAEWEAAVLGTTNHQAEWLIQSAPGQKDTYNIICRSNGQPLGVGDNGRVNGPVGLYHPPMTQLDNPQNWWTVTRYEGNKPGFGPFAGDGRPWVHITSVKTGQFLIPGNNGARNAPVGLFWEPGTIVDNVQGMWVVGLGVAPKIEEFTMGDWAWQPGQQPQTIKKVTVVNRTSLAQSHTMDFQIETNRSVTSTWNNTFTVTIGVEVKAKVQSIFSGSVTGKLEFSNSIEVGKTTTNSDTVTETYSFPVNVAPHTRVVGQAAVFAGTTKIPFTVVLSDGTTGNTWTETGTMSAEYGSASVIFSIVEDVALTS